MLAEHQDLTLTGLYNVLEKLRAGEALTTKEQDIHERGLVSVMRHLHDEIDAAVFDAYGWPRDLSDEEILGRLVELNKERRAEEATGLVRWLRPEYQAPAAKTIVVKEQGQLDITQMPTAAEGARKSPGRKRCRTGSRASAACWRRSPNPPMPRSWPGASTAPRATMSRRS